MRLFDTPTNECDDVSVSVFWHSLCLRSPIHQPSTCERDTLTMCWLRLRKFKHSNEHKAERNARQYFSLRVCEHGMFRSANKNLSRFVKGRILCECTTEKKQTRLRRMGNLATVKLVPHGIKWVYVRESHMRRERSAVWTRRCCCLFWKSTYTKRAIQLHSQRALRLCTRFNRLVSFGYSIIYTA